MPAPQAVVYLVRHAHSTANGRGILAGRVPGVALSERGQAEAELLAKRLEALSLDLVISSPLQRCIETIAPFRRSSKRTIFRKDARIQEMDYGTWSGKKLKYLATLRLWNQIQAHPASVRFPEGESFLEMSLRANSAVMDAKAQGKSIAIISHGDVIKSIIAHHVGLTVDDLQKFIVDPASISTIILTDHGSLIMSLNDTSHLASMRSSTAKRRPNRNTLGGGAGAK
ncbi:MAG: histidine phosphatase family protein [Actinomycetes bacterium]